MMRALGLLALAGGAAAQQRFLHTPAATKSAAIGRAGALPAGLAAGGATVPDAALALGAAQALAAEAPATSAMAPAAPSLSTEGLSAQSVLQNPTTQTALQESLSTGLGESQQITAANLPTNTGLEDTAEGVRKLAKGAESLSDLSDPGDPMAPRPPEEDRMSEEEMATIFDSFRVGSAFTTSPEEEKKFQSLRTGLGTGITRRQRKPGYGQRGRVLKV